MAAVTLLVASEYDDHARAALGAALDRAGARRLWPWSGHGGSQQIEFCWYLLRGRIIRIKAETYVGLTVRGTARLVEPLAAAIRSATAEQPAT